MNSKPIPVAVCVVTEVTPNILAILALAPDLNADDEVSAGFPADAVLAARQLDGAALVSSGAVLNVALVFEDGDLGGHLFYSYLYRLRFVRLH